MQAIKPQIRLTYNSRDITRDVSPYLASLQYTGEVKGKADTVEVVMEDTAALWRNNWYPTKGDRLELEIGYPELMVACGAFTVDEIALAGPPDQITIRGIATGFARALRTKNSFAHERKTLAQIATVVASKNGLTVTGTIPDVFIRRATQYRETDLCFLERLAGDYGCVFSIRDTSLIFTIADDLEAGAAGSEIDRTDLVSYNLDDKTSESWAQVSVKYHDPKTKTTVSATAEGDGDTVPIIPAEAWVDPLTAASYLSSDTLEIRNKRTENKGQAQSVAASALRQNLQKLTGTIKLPGNPLLMEGSNFDLTGMGALSGKFHVVRCEHSIDASGYFTTLDIKRTGAIAKTRWQPKQVINQSFQTTKR